MPSQILEKNPVIGPQLAIIMPSGVQLNTLPSTAIVLAATFLMPPQRLTKNAEIGVQLAMIKPAARATPMAISMIGLTLSTELIRSKTWVAPVTAVCIAENAMAAVASVSTSFGLSATRRPTPVNNGSSPTTNAPTAGANAASMEAETLLIESLKTFIDCAALWGAFGISTPFAASPTSASLPLNASDALIPSTNGVITLPPLNRPLISSLPRQARSRLFLKLSTFETRALSLGDSSSDR